MGKLRLKAFTLEVVHKCQVLNDSEKKMGKQTKSQNKRK